MRLRALLVAIGLAAAAGLSHGAGAAVPKSEVTEPIGEPPRPSWGGLVSGLPWASGSSSKGFPLQELRGRGLDVETMFMANRGTWAQMVASAAWVGNYARRHPDEVKIAVSIGLVPKAARGQFVACANGDFDQHIRQIGTTLLAKSDNHTLLLRLGWEANNLNSFPWEVTGDGTTWKACFRRWVDVLRSLPGSERFVMVWNMATKGHLPYHVDQIYPGNEYVDIVATEYYDRCPAITNEKLWQQRLNSTKPNGSPTGLGSWLAYAKSKGKRLAIPEWGIGGPRKPGVCNKTVDGGIDNPFFIQRFRQWLEENADAIAWEGYFNGDLPAGSHALLRANGTRPNPQAATAYERW